MSTALLYLFALQKKYLNNNDSADAMLTRLNVEFCSYIKVLSEVLQTYAFVEKIFSDLSKLIYSRGNHFFLLLNSCSFKGIWL